MLLEFTHFQKLIVTKKLSTKFIKTLPNLDTPSRSHKNIDLSTVKISFKIVCDNLSAIHYPTFIYTKLLQVYQKNPY